MLRQIFDIDQTGKLSSVLFGTKFVAVGTLFDIQNIVVSKQFKWAAFSNQVDLLSVT